MSNDLKRFILKIVMTVSVLVLLGWMVFTFIIPEYYIPILPYLLAFFTFITVLIHAWQLWIAKKDMQRFARSSMIISMLRLFLYSAVAIIYFANYTGNLAVFVISIIIIYIVFTFITVKDISEIARKKD